MWGFFPHTHPYPETHPLPLPKREGRPNRPKARILCRASKDTHTTAGTVPHASSKEMFDRLLIIMARRLRRFFLYLRNLRGKCVAFWHAEYAEYADCYCICGIREICVENKFSSFLFLPNPYIGYFPWIHGKFL